MFHSNWQVTSHVASQLAGSQLSSHCSVQVKVSWNGWKVFCDQSQVKQFQWYLHNKVANFQHIMEAVWSY